MIETEKYNEAIKVYEEYLKQFPKNGWAYHGMKLVYKKINNKAKVEEMNRLIADAWTNADVKIATSRIK